MKKWAFRQVDKFAKQTLKVHSKRCPADLRNLSVEHKSILSMHFQNTQTLKSVRRLARYRRTCDIATLNRSIFESDLSMALLCEPQPNEWQNRYATFSSIEFLRMYRKLSDVDKEIASKLYKFNGLTEIETDYTAKYGKPQRSWSGMNNLEICKRLDKEYPPVMGKRYFFQYMYCLVYSRGSWALHRGNIGLLENVDIQPPSFAAGKEMRYVTRKGENLVTDYVLGLVSYVLSMRLIGRALKVDFLERYFQEQVDVIMGEYG